MDSVLSVSREAYQKVDIVNPLLLVSLSDARHRPPTAQGRRAQPAQILEAAGELFAERGLGVTLNDVAHHAGVGVGTVYRRFPERRS